MRLPRAGRRSPVLPPGKVVWLGGWGLQRPLERKLTVTPEKRRQDEANRARVLK